MSSMVPVRSSSDLTSKNELLAGVHQGPPLQSVIDATKVLVWSADSLGRFEWVCGCWTAMTGQPAQAALGDGWLEAIHSDDRDRLIEQWRSTDISSHSFESQVRVSTSDGGYRWRLLRANRIAEPASHGAKWLGVFLDVDAMVEARVASDSSAQAVLETVMDGIVTISETGSIESFNPAATRMFGYQSEEAIGQDVSILMPPPNAEEHGAYLRRYLQTGEKQIIGVGRELVGRRKDGSTFPLELSVGEVQLRDRRFFTGVLRDLTDIRSSQQAQIRAERLAAIGQMVAAIGHESRNALQRIQASVEMLKLQLNDHAECKKDIDTIERADAELRRLFSEIRNWVAPVNLVCKQHDIRDSCSCAWEHAMSVRRSRDASFCFQAEGVDTHLEADGQRLEQVFRNLFENAIDAGNDPIQVVVEVDNTTLGDSPAVTVIIRDNGPGIPAGDSNRFFEAFYTTKRCGVGLGLAITRRIVETHHGVVDLKAASPAGGTEVVLTLPRSQTQAHPHNGASTESSVLLDRQGTKSEGPGDGS